MLYCTISSACYSDFLSSALSTMRSGTPHIISDHTMTSTARIVPTPIVPRTHLMVGTAVCGTTPRSRGSRTRWKVVLYPACGIDGWLRGEEKKEGKREWR